MVAKLVKERTPRWTRACKGGTCTGSAKAAVSQRFFRRTTACRAKQVPLEVLNGAKTIGGFADYLAEEAR